MKINQSQRWTRIGRILGAVALSAALSGCVVQTGPAPHGWCWWHPHRCGY